MVSDLLIYFANDHPDILTRAAINSTSHHFLETKIIDMVLGHYIHHPMFENICKRGILQNLFFANSMHRIEK